MVSQHNQRLQSHIHTAGDEALQQVDTQDLERIRELAIAYNEAIVPGTAEKAYSQAALMEASVDYQSQLGLSGNGIKGYICQQVYLC